MTYLIIENQEQKIKENMMQVFLRWWLMVVFMIAGLVMLWFTDVGLLFFTGGLISNLIISVIALLLLSMTVYCGYLCYQFVLAKRLVDKDSTTVAQGIAVVKAVRRRVDTGWIMASTCSRLGLLGTVIGFIIMAVALGNWQAGDPVATQKVMIGMANGLAVALYTTLAGQMGNILLSLQFHNLLQGTRTFLNE